MSKSTQLVTASYIASYVGAAYPAQVNTDSIAKVVNTHPSRVRRLVSKLVKAGILRSHRGSAGGVALSKEADQVTLADIYDAVQEQPILCIGVHEIDSEEGGKAFLSPTFENLYQGLESKMRHDLQKIKLSDLVAPWLYQAAAE